MKNDVGVLFVGLNGGVATTSIVGAYAISEGLVPPTGLYTETMMSSVVDGKLDRYNQKPIKDVLGLVDMGNLVFGGWDIEDGNVYEYAKDLEIAPKEIVDKLRDKLVSIGPMPGVFNQNYVKNLEGNYVIPPKDLADITYVLRDNISKFKERHDLENVIVVNVASTEKYNPLDDVHSSLESFQSGLEDNNQQISPSQLYAYAALFEGAPYINFTPSIAEEIPALQELAQQSKTPIAGKDGKTGQTLIKTAVAPVFRLKNLYVDGWFSTNILGNKDGLVLNHPESLESKIKTKASVLDQILGKTPDNWSGIHDVNINYYPPRGDDKEAWDNIDFSGLLGMPMQLKLNFLCKDSILAGGAVLDLVRFMDYCKKEGEVGIQEQLSFFFKSPDTTEGKDPIHDFFKQEGILKDWLREKAFGVTYS